MNLDDINRTLAIRVMKFFEIPSDWKPTQNLIQAFQCFETFFPDDLGYDLTLSLCVSEDFSGYIGQCGSLYIHSDKSKSHVICLLCLQLLKQMNTFVEKPRTFIKKEDRQ